MSSVKLDGPTASTGANSFLISDCPILSSAGPVLRGKPWPVEPCTAGKATLTECYAERRSMQLIQVHQPDRSISSHLLPLFLSDVIFVFGHPYFFIFCLACLAVVPRGVDLQFQQAKWGAMGGYMRSLAHTHAPDPHSHQLQPLAASVFTDCMS